jgi:hypothetical protein
MKSALFHHDSFVTFQRYDALIVLTPSLSQLKRKGEKKTPLPGHFHWERGGCEIYFGPKALHHADRKLSRSMQHITA